MQRSRNRLSLVEAKTGPTSRELRRGAPGADRRAAEEANGPEAQPRSPDSPRSGSVSPVQVVMDQISKPGSGVEIHWDNGRSVRLHRGFDRQTLADVLAVLEARPC